MLPIVTVHHLPQPQRCANTHTGRAWGHYYCRYICLNEDAWQCVCACLLLCVGVCFDFWFDLPTINTKSWGVCWESVSTHWYECSESNLAYMLMQHVTPLMWLLSPTVLCKKKVLYILNENRRVFCQRQEGHFITVSLVELMEKKMVSGAVCLHTSLAVIITDNKAVGSRGRERRDRRRWWEERWRGERRERCPANVCATKPLCI